MTKYLYGASIHGIQDFIFNTNKLKEIAGASNIINDVANKIFVNLVNEDVGVKELQRAAGNIKCIFDSKSTLEAVYRNFPKLVSTKAPGITISQAVVPFENNLIDAVEELSSRLEKQRNRPAFPYEVGFMAIDRSPKTGALAFKSQNQELIDEATVIKRNRNMNAPWLGAEDRFSDKMDDLVSPKNNWLSVIHADGNGLGLLIQKMGQTLKHKDYEDQVACISTFSTKLDVATKSAVKKALDEVMTANDSIYPLRPVIIGGDDVTVVIRADLALDFTHKFLTHFEQETQVQLAFLIDYNVTFARAGLTACAGIAYIKKNYPFHYGVDLAESLCKAAKRYVKKQIERRPDGLPKSAVEFFKVQDSFIEDLATMKLKNRPTEEIDFNYGPYVLGEGLAYLTQRLEFYNEKSKASGQSSWGGKMRKLLSEYHNNTSAANLLLDRISQIEPKLGDFINSLQKNSQGETIKKSMLLDIMHLSTF